MGILLENSKFEFHSSKTPSKFFSKKHAPISRDAFLFPSALSPVAPPAEPIRKASGASIASSNRRVFSPNPTDGPRLNIKARIQFSNILCLTRGFLRRIFSRGMGDT